MEEHGIDIDGDGVDDVSIKDGKVTLDLNALLKRWKGRILAYLIGAGSGAAGLEFLPGMLKGFLGG